MSRPRYALYYAPPAETALWRFGSAVLGYDAVTAEDIAFTVPQACDPAAWAELTAEPRRYGFHATLKAPFELATGRSEAQLRALEREAKAQRCQEGRDDAEEQDRPLDAIEGDDRAQDAPAVAIGRELADRSFRARAIGGHHLGHRHRQFERMDADLGLDLEAGGQHREALDEAAREDAIARQDIGEAPAEQLLQQAGQRPVAEAMATPIGCLHLVATTAYHHIEIILQHGSDHLRRGSGLIGRVAIGHDVDVGIDIGEHAAHDMALALLAHAPDDGP